MHGVAATLLPIAVRRQQGLQPARCRIPWRDDGTTHLIVSPWAFMRRLAVLVTSSISAMSARKNSLRPLTLFSRPEAKRSCSLALRAGALSEKTSACTRLFPELFPDTLGCATTPTIPRRGPTSPTTSSISTMPGGCIRRWATSPLASTRNSMRSPTEFQIRLIEVSEKT
jgi:hypothetical protein